MSIRIQNDGIAGSAASQVSHTTGPAAGTSSGIGSGKGISGSDQVDLSSLSGAMASSLSALSTQQANRVSQLAALYARGNYQIDATNISRSMISSALGAGALGTDN